MKTIRHICLVDDDRIFLTISTFTLKKILPDVQISSFMNPEEALDAIAALNPDLLLLDINMPFLDGWEFLAGLETKIAKKIQFPIYICSSSVDLEDKRKAEKNLLVKGFIEKPLDHDKITALITSL